MKLTTILNFFLKAYTKW